MPKSLFESKSALPVLRRRSPGQPDDMPCALAGTMRPDCYCFHREAYLAQAVGEGCLIGQPPPWMPVQWMFTPLGC